VLDTDELRWFVPGPLPRDLRIWFTGSTGVAEERRDIYLVGHRVDLGIKRRSGNTLELKVRRELGAWTDLGAGLGGRLERWRRWTPADGLVDQLAPGPWVDVDKAIVKRRFAPDGTELAFSPEPTIDGGCDVEVAAVNVGTTTAWTFAFAAFGPPAIRRAAVFASWAALTAGVPCSWRTGHDVGRTMGYPEWLARTLAPDIDVSR
jgi:hypothetical protein